MNDEPKKMGAADTEIKAHFSYRLIHLEQHCVKSVKLWSSICCYRQLTFLPLTVINIKNIRYAAVQQHNQHHNILTALGKAIKHS